MREGQIFFHCYYMDMWSFHAWRSNHFSLLLGYVEFRYVKVISFFTVIRMYYESDIFKEEENNFFFFILEKKNEPNLC